MASSFIKQKIRALLLMGSMALMIAGLQWFGFYHSIEHAGLSSQTQLLSKLFKHTSHLSSEQVNQTQQAKSDYHLDHASYEQSDLAKGECQLLDSLLLGGYLTSAEFGILAHPHAIALPAAILISLAKQIKLWPYQSQAPPFITL